MKKRTGKESPPSIRTEHPGWIEIFIEVHPVAQEAVSAFLFDLGCKGVSDLLQEQVQEVEKPLGLLGFKEIQVVTQGEWACITAKRKE